MNHTAAMDQFKQVGVNSQVESADPHTLVAMLFDGLLERLSRARGYIERGQMQQKGEMLSKSIAIIDGLRASVDRSADEQLSSRLVDLYDHMEVRLLQANSASDASMVQEVYLLASELKAGWDGIAPAERKRAE
ncbi:MAG: flagellar export chaperone FliS [Halieaceae bacterium]|nr:flagellar export chaperone FliS [Halieaceae bacterium]